MIVNCQWAKIMGDYDSVAADTYDDPNLYTSLNDFRSITVFDFLPLPYKIAKGFGYRIQTKSGVRPF